MWWPVVLGVGALAAVIVSWTRLYRRWTWHDWITAGIAGVFLSLAAMTFFSWVPKYRATEEYDWPIAARLHVWIALISGGLPLIWCLIRRLADSAYDSALGGLLRMVGTVLYSSLALGAIAAGSVALSLALLRPGRRFLGYDLFPRNIYYFDRVPVEINPASIAWVVALTLLVSVVFSVYPAIRAARTDPIEAIRDE
jgi:ABC-type antimicrobial peptide transport system permease subunit